ncbi:MAG: GGDEF domain-containing protein [Lachnospiraceae bacterium]|nr:GGDEF domain-containing protein [Lachnospiraceae bacterium]
MEEIEKVQYQDELKANKFSTMFLSIMCGICLLIWAANEVGIFVVNRAYMRLGMIIGCICLLIPVGIFLWTKGTNKWFKYVLIICVSLMSISIQTFLTFHGVMLCVFPVLLAAQYTDLRVFRLALWVNLFGVLIAVILGYYFGCWDGNMIYATTYGISLEKDSFANRAAVMNQDYMTQLLLYFALPRMVIFSVISLSLSYILKVAKLQYVRQNRIRMQAECDGLTGLENRAKYNQRVSREYPKLDAIYIVYLDVNFLKKMNDTCGHEAGDFVLKRVAEEMRKLIADDIHGYRLGGDEFALIFCNYSEEAARSMITKWETNLKPLNRREDPVHCSLATGSVYASRPFDMETLLKKADESMYERKKAMKAQRIS